MRLPGRLELLAASLIAAVLAACSPGAEETSTTVGSSAPPPRSVAVVAEGLINPLGLALLPDGGLLIAEEGTGEDDASAGASVLTPDGRVGRVVTGLPSGRDAGDLSGVPLVGVSPDGTTGYVAHFGSEALLSFPIPDGGLQPESKATPALTLADLTRTMTPLNNVALTNPFDIAFAEDRPVVSDASENGIATVQGDGTVVFTHRLGDLADPDKPTLRIDPVPTGIARVGDEFYVTLTGGCPYPDRAGVVAAVGEDRSQRLVAQDLTMPIDVEVGPSGTIWLLEFASFDPEASCFSGEGYQPQSGRLSTIAADGTVIEVMSGLDFPGAVVEAPNGDVYISEIFAGRILRLSWTDPAAAGPPATPPPAAPWKLRDVAAAVGLNFVHGAFASGLADDPAAMMGGGLCWLDYDNDGWLDLYLVNSYAIAEVEYWQTRGGLPANALYRNDGGMFRDTGPATGVAVSHRGNGCVAADFDGDGWTDLFVTADGPNLLFHNQGDGTFAEIGAAAGIDTPEWNTAAVVGDIDGDGLPDLFVGAYIDLAKRIDKPSGAFPQDYLGLPDRLFLNRSAAGAIRMEEVTAAAGLDLTERTLGALLSDFDNDGDLDLYIANDGHPNRLHRNDTTGGGAIVLTDVTRETGVGDSGSGMGVAGGDYDGNGAFDVIVTNWEAELNALYANQSTADDGLAFGYMTQRIGLAGLGNNKTGWGVAWADMDNDTDLDMVIAHGRVPVTDLTTDPELVRLYGNLLAEGDPGQFRDWTTRTGLDAVGPRLARGSAMADFDNDGDLDIAINSVAGAVSLLANEDPPGHFVGVEVTGFHPGMVVTVELGDGTTLRREWHAGSSYLASEDHRFHFGLGDRVDPIAIRITWPDGATRHLESLAVDRYHRVLDP